MSNLIIAPSILASDFSNLEKEFNRMHEDKIEYVHYDVMDGNFVPNISFGPLFIQHCMKLAPIKADIHLMIDRPEYLLEDFKELKPANITIHYEATKYHRRLFSEFGEISRGLTIIPSTPIEMVYDLLDVVDQFLIMSVDPGFSGQKFIRNSLLKAEKLKAFISKNGLKTKIQMDGGINDSNIKDIESAGVDIVVMGYGYFKNQG